MSGTVLDQSNVTIEISIDGGTEFVDFDCATSFDTGAPSVSFTDVSCFSTATAEPEYSAGRLTRSVGSVAYYAKGSTVHQYLMTNPGATVPIRSVVTFDNEDTYTRTQSYIIGGVSEPIEFDGSYVHTVELQPTGAVTRAYA